MHMVTIFVEYGIKLIINSLHLCENMLAYLSTDIICSQKQIHVVFKSFSQHAQAVFKIGEYSGVFPSFSWGIFGHMKCLDQSRVSKNIAWITGYNGSYTMPGDTMMAKPRKTHLPRLLFFGIFSKL